MIYPWLMGFLSWHKAPMTWALVLTNVFLFMMVQGPNKNSSSSFQSPENLILAGKMYDQYLSPDQETLPLKADSEWMLLGAQAVRDKNFHEALGTKSFRGDQVQIEKWKKSFSSYKNDFETRTTRLFGLSHDHGMSLNWITYQFTHAGWFHLLGNMGFLMLFAGALEVKLGGLVVALLYLFSGWAAGSMFLTLSGSSTIPVVGASGSLTGIMAFYAVYEIKKRVKFLYFVSPLEGYWGFIYLPKIALVPLLFLPDLVGYFSSSDHFGQSIAYTAHLGGAAFGLTAALVFKMALLFSRSKASSQ
jgi:membrane associated rhomboid family serine protease